MNAPPYKIATLVFIENQDGDQLLLHRKQKPNLGLWTPIGGKLDIETGESPVECAVRETLEETGYEIQPDQLHLFGYLAETNYEGDGHWLIFLFRCREAFNHLPPPISEGTFQFHSFDTIQNLPIPESDREILWPVYRKNADGFTGVRIRYNNPEDPTPFTATIEQEIFIPKG